MRRCLGFLTRVGLVSLAGFAGLRGQSLAERWQPAPQNPVLAMDRMPAGFQRKSKSPMIWNDPSVLKEGSAYFMWASAGPGGPKGVAIYRLRSTDGVSWTVENQGRPVLEPGGKKDFDSMGVETPMVVKVGGTYHMYYSAYPFGKIPLVTLGHAVSTDGTRWKKTGELTSITSVVGHHQGNPWGRLGRGEPAVAYRDGTFYLYFTDVRCRQEDCKGATPVIRGISLAMSKDGQNFQQQGSEPIVMPSSSYPSSAGWEGYSTPWVMLADGQFQLFADVFRSIGKESIQTELLHLQSADGIRFREAAAGIIVAGRETWASVSVRSPSVIVSDGAWRMWYAGDNYDPATRKARAGTVNAGIGLAMLNGR